jgi:hypothetical protein
MFAGCESRPTGISPKNLAMSSFGVGMPLDLLAADKEDARFTWSSIELLYGVSLGTGNIRGSHKLFCGLGLEQNAPCGPGKVWIGLSRRMLLVSVGPGRYEAKTRDVRYSQ